MKTWNGKLKAVTFSFDDGVTQDRRLVELFNRYGLKATFNLNSGVFGTENQLARNGVQVRHDKVDASEVKSLYQGHEVAVHTLTHPDLTKLSEEEVIRQVEEDRKALSALCGYEVVGMAYPGGTCDKRTAQIIKNNTGVKYSRTVVSTHSFDVQTEDMLIFNPTVYYVEPCLEEIVDAFLALKTDKPQLLYIWGHAYEMDAKYISWEAFERICEKLSGKDDIFYGTNAEVLL